MKKLSHPGNIILIGFGVMVLFMSYLVYQCTQNPAVMVSNNYYEQELKYQDVIDAKENTVAYNDSLTMMKEEGQISFRIPDGINKDLTTASVMVYNRADDKKDRHIELKKSLDGIYAVSTKEWGQGNYELKLSIQSGDKAYYKEFNY